MIIQKERVKKMANEVATAKKQLAHSEVFTNMVIREFGSSVAGAFPVTDYQRQLIQGYFIQIDRALTAAEERRVKDNSWKSNKNNDPIKWETVDKNKLALDVMHYARIGLDMMQPNHLYAIPYKDNNRTSKEGTKMYTVNLMPGYNGIKYIAEKYAMEKPSAVITELVYRNDTFKPIKKSRDNAVESYEFEINNPFDRGEIVGGFGYIEYPESEKNKLIIMTKRDIEKRKPKHAAAEFWGGVKKEKKDGEWQEIQTDGWYEEMCLKTIKREVYSAKHMPLDPKKIDDNYQYMKMQELRLTQMQVADIVDEQTASVPVEIPAVEEKHHFVDAGKMVKDTVPEYVEEKAAGEESLPEQMAIPGF